MPPGRRALRQSAEHITASLTQKARVVCWNEEPKPSTFVRTVLYFSDSPSLPARIGLLIRSSKMPKGQNLKKAAGNRPRSKILEQRGQAVRAAGHAAEESRP